MKLIFSILFIIPTTPTTTTTTTTPQPPQSPTPVCIIGAGPGGLQLSTFFSEANIQHIVFEKASHAGAFFVHLPVQGKLISINKRHTTSTHPDHKLRHDWNSLLNVSIIQHSPMTMWSNDMFPTAHRYVEYLKSFSQKLNTIQYNKHVIKIDKNLKTNIFELTIQDTITKTTTHHYCNKLVLANGITKPVELKGLKGYSSLVTQYINASPYGKDYNGHRVLILGSGNSAHEMSQAMVGYAAHVHIASRSPLRLGAFTHYVGDLRGVNLEFLDTYQLKSLDVKIEIDNLEEKFQFVNCSEHFDAGPYEPPIIKYGSGSLICLLPKFLNINNNASMEEKKTWKEWLADLRDHSPFRTPFETVVSALGFEYDTSIFASNAKPVMRFGIGRRRYPAITCAYESVNIDNLFVTGTLSHSRDFKRAAGGFVHGFRYQALALTRILLRGLSNGGRGVPQPPPPPPPATSEGTTTTTTTNQCPSFNTFLSHTKYPLPTNSISWPLNGEETLSFDVTEIVDAFIYRIRTSSALYQLFSELVDVIILDNPIQNKVRILHEVPRCACTGPMEEEQLFNWRNNTFAGVLNIEQETSCGSNDIREYWNGDQRAFGLCDDRYSRFVLSFRYRPGFKGPKVIGPDRVGSTHPKYANESNFLHPVVEFIPSMSAMSVSPPDSFHFVEDVQAQWSTDFNDIDPFRTWIRRVLGRGGNPRVKAPHFVFTSEGEFESMKTNTLKMKQLIPGVHVELIRGKYKSLLKGKRGIYLGPSSADLSFCEFETFACLSKRKAIQKVAVRWFDDMNKDGIVEIVWLDYLRVVDSEVGVTCEIVVADLVKQASVIEQKLVASGGGGGEVILAHDLIQVKSDVMTESESCNHLEPSCHREQLGKMNDVVKVVSWNTCVVEDNNNVNSMRWCCGLFVMVSGKDIPIYVPFSEVKIA